MLKVAGLIDTAWFTDEARDRGTNVATITELDDLKILNEDQVPPGLSGYLAAWRTFREDTDCVIIEVETVVHDGLRGYAGTLDRVIEWGLSTTVIDIKTGSPSPWHALQTAAYAACLRPPVVSRAAVYLDGNGKYRCQHHMDHIADLQAFYATLAVANWKVLHGLESYGN